MLKSLSACLKTSFVLTLLLTITLAQQANLSFGAIDEAAQTIEILLTNDAPVAGVQFSTSGATFTFADGVSAVENGWKISVVGSGTVIGFTLGMSYIPVTATPVPLMNLHYSALTGLPSDITMSGGVVSPPPGQPALTVSYGPCDDPTSTFLTEAGHIPGCTYPDALNYCDTCPSDDDSCDHGEPPQFYHNVTFIDGSDKSDSSNGASAASFDCNGVEGGTAFIDDCGNCVGGDTGLEENYAMDCAGVCDGPYLVDDCGDCVDPANFNAAMDCNGVCDGAAFENECGCVGGNTGLLEDFCFGCTDPDALNYCDTCTIDDGSCLYGIPPEFQFNLSTVYAIYLIQNAEIDGISLDPEDWIGAFKGDICVGAAQWTGEFTGIPVTGDDGNPQTGGYMVPGDIPAFKIYDASSAAYLTATASEDIPWSYFSNTFITLLSAWSIPADCAGVIGGGAFLDDCGVCSGGETGLEPNMEDENGFITGPDADCNGECFGSAIIDDCDICSGGNSGHPADSDMDCLGVCFGSAVTCEDECFNLGDMNGDGQADVIDVIYMIDLILNWIPPNDCELTVGDIYADNLLDIRDIVMIVEIIIGNI